MQLGTVGSLWGVAGVVKVELVDRRGSLQVAWEVLVGRPTVIKAVPTPGLQTSSVIKPATYFLVVLMWATVAKVSLKEEVMMMMMIM